MMKVLDGEPWSFDKHMMVMQVYDGSKDVRDLSFDLVPFWVQVHDLPLRFRKRRVAEQLCEAIGNVTHGEVDPTREGERFVRVRVTLDISKPLCRGRLTTLDDGKVLWLPFKYKRLPNLCYWCGCLDHDDKSCDIWIESKGSLTAEKQQYGPWIRAPPFAPSKSKVVTVPGFYESRKKAFSPPFQVRDTTFPVVVLHSDNQSPEVIWPEKQGNSSNPPDMGVPDFSPMNSVMPVMSQVDVTEEESVHANAGMLDNGPEPKSNFEETLESLDKDIAKFDAAPIGCEDKVDPLGPPKPGPNIPPLSPNPKTPLANISNLSPSLNDQPLITSPKWTRFKRQGGSIEETESLNTALGKRVALLPHSEAKPPKRRTFHGSSQKENSIPLAEAGP